LCAVLVTDPSPLLGHALIDEHFVLGATVALSGLEIAGTGDFGQCGTAYLTVRAPGGALGVGVVLQPAPV